MPALSDQMLADGCVKHIHTVHGENVLILSGPDAGKTIPLAVQENESDQIVVTEQGEDARAKRFIRFQHPNIPQLGSQGEIRTTDVFGKNHIWNAVRQPGSAYLTVDYELTEITDKDS